MFVPLYIFNRKCPPWRKILLDQLINSVIIEQHSYRARRRYCKEFRLKNFFQGGQYRFTNFKKYCGNAGASSKSDTTSSSDHLRTNRLIFSFASLFWLILVDANKMYLWQWSVHLRLEKLEPPQRRTVLYKQLVLAQNKSLVCILALPRFSMKF